MSSRRLLVALAAVAVAIAGFATGGTTYAAWSDFEVIEDNQVGAGTWFSPYLPAECPVLDATDVDPSDGSAWGYTIVIGTDGPDVLVGDRVNGNKRDLIFGRDGSDNIQGGNQDDCLVGGGGDDIIGGDGPTENGKDVLLGGPGNDQLDGGNAIDVLFGGDGDDVILGSNGPDEIYGGEGIDDCTGGRAPDLELECELIDGIDPTTTVAETSSTSIVEDTETTDATDGPSPTPDDGDDLGEGGTDLTGSGDAGDGGDGEADVTGTTIVEEEPVLPTGGDEVDCVDVDTCEDGA